MDSKFIEEIAIFFAEKKCKYTIKDNVLFLEFFGITESLFWVDFNTLDEAGTLSVKVNWIIGKVVDFAEVIHVLALNYGKFKNTGPLFGAVKPAEDDSIDFLLVGNLILPAGTSAQEVALTLYFNVFTPYAMFKMEVPGVRLFDCFQ